MRKSVFVTPKSFLSYLGSYKTLYLSKYFDEYDIQEKTFRKGTGKINEAKVTIGKMDVDLKIESEKLKIATD
jgi:dynein heavy chain